MKEAAAPTMNIILSTVRYVFLLLIEIHRTCYLIFSFSAVNHFIRIGNNTSQTSEVFNWHLHFTASRTSSIICPAFNSTTRIPFMFLALSANGLRRERP